MIARGRAHRPPTPLEQLLARCGVDFPSTFRRPPAWRFVLATIVSLVGSLAADVVLVAAGKGVFPSTKHYVHFHPTDYGKLTIIGVVIACVAWPVVMWGSSVARWLFLRLAALVTAVLLLPDVYLLLKHQPPKAVLVLMCMHLAIGVVTYNALVRIAPEQRHDRHRKHEHAEMQPA